MTKEQSQALKAYLDKHGELIAQLVSPTNTESVDSIDAKLVAVESEMGLLEYEIDIESIGAKYGEAV